MQNVGASREIALSFDNPHRRQNNLSRIFIFFASWQAGLLFCAIKTPGSPSAAWERSVGDCRCRRTGDGRREASALPNPLSCWVSSQQTVCRRLRSVPFAEVGSALAQSARLDLIRSFEPESLPQYEVGQSGRAPNWFERHITILFGPILKGRREWLCSLSLTDAAFPALGSLTGLPGLVSGLSTSRRGPRRPRRSRDADGPDGIFSLYIRAYWGKEAIIEGSWQPPRKAANTKHGAPSLRPLCVITTIRRKRAATAIGVQSRLQPRGVRSPALHPLTTLMKANSRTIESIGTGAGNGRVVSG